MSNKFQSHEEANDGSYIRNRWHLYEWLKQQYMRTGRIPTAGEARAEFPELPLEEMGEGYTEFMAVVGRFEKGV